MRTAQVFISYRRDDAAGYARAVYAELAREFGAERIFIDVDDIAAGQAFDKAIRREVGAAQVLLALIGRRWLGERDGAPARIHDVDDFVRIEVATGLARGMRVIPLLLDGAPMPSEAQLPEALRPLARRNALELDNSRFAADIKRLVATLRETLAAASSAAPAPPVRRRVSLRAAMAGVLLIGTAVFAGAWFTRGGGTGAAAAARPDINGAWRAEVSYDWPNAKYSERFEFAGEGAELHGSASFLGAPRGLLEGRFDPDGLVFVTRTREVGAGGSGELVHRYRGRRVGDELRFVMQTEGGASAHLPVEFVARRGGPGIAASAP